MTSLAIDQDVIVARGVGQAPGIAGVAFAATVFTASVGSVIRRPRPSYVSSLWIALAAYLAYLAAVGIAAALGGVDLALSLAVVGSLAIGWFGPLVGVAALIAGLVAIALVRTRADRPHWPWEPPGEG